MSLFLQQISENEKLMRIISDSYDRLEEDLQEIRLIDTVHNNIIEEVDGLILQSINSNFPLPINNLKKSVLIDLFKMTKLNLAKENRDYFFNIFIKSKQNLYTSYPTEYIKTYCIAETTKSILLYNSLTRSKNHINIIKQQGFLANCWLDCLLCYYILYED